MEGGVLRHLSPFLRRITVHCFLGAGGCGGGVLTCTLRHCWSPPPNTLERETNLHKVESFTITEKSSNTSFSWLKAPTSLRQLCTDAKIKGQAALWIYAIKTACPLGPLYWQPNFAKVHSHLKIKHMLIATTATLHSAAIIILFSSHDMLYSLYWQYLFQIYYCDQVQWPQQWKCHSISHA